MSLGSLFRHPLPALWVAAAAAAVFAQSLGYGLLWDDPQLLAVVEERVRTGGLWTLLASPFYIESTEQLGYYRPVVLLSLWLDLKLSMLLPWIFHATNILLHAANSALAYLLFAELLPMQAAAVWGAVFFALHPIHSEPVVFVSGRTDLWATFFALTAAVVWAHSRKRTKGPGLWSLILAGIALALACLAKEVAFALPAVIVAAELLSPSPETFDRRLRRTLPWAAAFAAALGAVLALRAVIPGVGWDRGSIVALQSSAARWSTYVRLLLAPWPLSAYYTAPQVTISAVNVAATAGVLALCGTTAARSRERVGLIGLAWIVGFLLPGALFMRPGSLIALAERFLYLPSVGFCLAAGAAVDRLGRSLPARWPAVVVAGVAAAAMAWGTLARTPVWKDDLSLFKDAAEKSNAGLAWNNLGLAYYSRGQLSEAVAAYRKALTADPYAVKSLNNLGIALARAGRLMEAQASLEEALRIFPHFASAHHNLGIVLQMLGRRDEAIAHYREALRLKPDFADAAANLRQVLSDGAARGAP